MIKPNKHHHHIVNDSCVLDGCELRHSSDTNELDSMLLDFAKHVALQQMLANDRIREFYQIDDKANIDVGKTIKSISNYVERLIATKEEQGRKLGYAQGLLKGRADMRNQLKGDI